jgi:FMNH2-dependent dimethyl sulfone monooxygenase
MTAIPTTVRGQQGGLPITNPLFNDNRMKLGTFSTNCSNGAAASTAEGGLQLTWANTKALARMSDAAGFEALVPVGRWKGFGGATDFNGESFEVFTWAAALAEATTYSAVFATSHVPIVHPVLSAKQSSTIDHISGGRFALNVVCGWNPDEFAMFGSGALRSHDEGYAYANEWIEILQRLWTSEEEFDVSGAYFRLKGAISRPTPLQKPFPPIMCANNSEIGQRFAAKYADMSFIGIRSGGFDDWKRLIESHKRLARKEFGREIQVWTHAAVVCRPTMAEADRYFQYAAIERADSAGDPASRLGRPAPEYALRRMPGWGGFPLIGTPESIVKDLDALSRAGIAGCVLSWIDYEREQQQWIDEVLPLMEEAGLRRPFTKLGQGEPASALGRPIQTEEKALADKASKPA